MILLADSIGKSHGDRRILTSARLTAAGGEVVGLLGRMGEGKSTLLKICAGLIRPDSGWVELDGKRYPSAHRSRLAANGMFYLAEHANLVPSLTVAKHFDLIESRFGPGNRGNAIDLLSIERVLDSTVASLSSGETKRVELAIALVRRPRCFLGDESFRGLDPITCDSLGTALRELARSGCAVVITGHEVSTLQPYIDSVTWLTSSTTYQLGTAAEAWNNDRFQREYLGN